MMPAVNSLRPCAIAGALLATACTYNYNYPVEKTSETRAPNPAPRCSMVWSGVVPSGWTVQELRRFVDTIPESGCPAVELRVHRSGLPVSWDSNLGSESSGWVVRSALTQYVETGDRLLRRIHAFAEPSENPSSDTGRGGENGGGNTSRADSDGQNDGQKEPDRTPPSGNGEGTGIPPWTPPPVGPKGPDPLPPAPPPASPEPDVPSDDERSGDPHRSGNPDQGPSAWVARNAPPALVGGGVVYGLVYLNLIGIPAAGRAASQAGADLLRRRGRRQAEEAEEAVAAAAGAEAAPIGDLRVRIRSSAFEDPPA